MRLCLVMRICLESMRKMMRVTGVLTMVDGEVVAVVTVAIVDDGESEGDESFFVDISSASGGAQLGGRTSAMVRIVDDVDCGTVSFASPALEAVEGVAFGVELRREGGTSGEISVAVKGGEDCGVEGVAVSFSEGQSEVTQELVAEDNLVFEVRFGLVPHHAGPSAHCSPRSPRGRAC